MSVLETYLIIFYPILYQQDTASYACH